MKGFKGFSIPAVLVGSALMGILAAALVSLLTNSMKGTKFVETTLDFDEIRRNITLVLSDPAQCVAGLRSLNGGAFFVPNGQPSNGNRLHRIVLGSLAVAQVICVRSVIQYRKSMLRTLFSLEWKLLGVLGLRKRWESPVDHSAGVRQVVCC